MVCSINVIAPLQRLQLCTFLLLNVPNVLLLTLTKGASASFASRRAISVFPQPVGPIMRIFFGTISSCNISEEACDCQILPGT